MLKPHSSLCDHAVLTHVLLMYPNAYASAHTLPCNCFTSSPCPASLMVGIEQCQYCTHHVMTCEMQLVRGYSLAPHDTANLATAPA